MKKEFTFHCGASVLVDDAYAKFDVKATSVEEAWDKAMGHCLKSSVLDSGSLDMRMDTRELAIALGNMASENEEEWEPTYLMKELESIKDKEELLSTLEWIVSNANKEVG